MKTAFVPDANTSVTLVRAFRAGDALTLAAGSGGAPPVAATDLCLVKLNVGPGTPGPASAPSTSAGIGIEIWLPSPSAWNSRIHNLGGGGWAGGNQGSLTLIGSTGAAATAAAENSVVGTTDTGHVQSQGSVFMKPDGTINTQAFTDFSTRSLHALAQLTKSLSAAYYLKRQDYAYWDGCSTGGRQGYSSAQADPGDYDGYLIGAPALNYFKLGPSSLYNQIAYNTDLGGVALTTAQLNFVGGQAVSACDMVGGSHRGVVLDPSTCNYDPTRDAAALCAGAVSNGVTGTNSTATCVSPAQARVVNKIYFGMTSDGSVPDPALNNGLQPYFIDGQLAYGTPRGGPIGTGNLTTGAAPFTIGTDVVALALQNSSYAQANFVNATGNGANAWTTLTYGSLAAAYYQGHALQPTFGNLNADNPDLSGVRRAGAKILHYHGLADSLVPPGYSTNYYTQVANRDGGYSNTQAYARMFLIPGMGHCGGLGAPSGPAGPALTNSNLPLPAPGQLFSLMQAWVEGGAASAPASITLNSADATASQLLCQYPRKATYLGAGSISAASSYACR
jgi:feruloyl esterase